MNLLIVGLGGAIGAVLRYGLYNITPNEVSLSLMTIIINSIGSFLLGLLFYMFTQRNNKFYLFATTGILSGFTTFSTFSLETITYIQNGQFTEGLVNIALSILVCIGSCAIGVYLGKVAKK